MEPIVQYIQDIRSMRKDIRDSKLSSTILTAIENIHMCIKNESDTNGWKKIDWRNGNSVRSGQNGKGKNGKGSFGNRPLREYSSHTFESRSKPIHSDPPVSIPLSGTVDGFRGTQKYISKFKKTSANVDDTILNTILLGKLNKFSHKNYNEIKEFITHIIDNGETDMIKCFMKLVFEKAATEEMFCPLYAKLLSELSTGYPILLDEMDNLYSHYMTIFDEVSDVSEINTENYNEFCKRNVKNKYRRGYSQFLAELIKHDVIELNLLIKTIHKIISQIENTNIESIKLNEEYADCLMKIIKAIQSGTDGKIKQIRILLKTDTLQLIYPLTVRGTDNIGISNKARYTFLDIYEGIKKMTI